MEFSLKNLLLAGIGSMAYTYERGASIVEEMIKKGELTVNQGKELTDELKRRVGTNAPAQTAAAPPVDALREVLSTMNLATRADIDDLRERLSRLEQKLP